MFIGASVNFLTKYGDEKTGKIVRWYSAFEGGVRYIVEADGVQYRCVWKFDEKENRNKLIEYVA